MPSSPLCQDGVDRAFGLDQTGRLSGPDTKHGPAATLAYCFRCLNEACLAVRCVKDKNTTSAASQPRDLGGNIVALVNKDVMCAGLSGQLFGLHRAATADDEA